MEPNSPDSLFGLQLDYESAGFFKTAAKWAKFLAIVYFVCIVIGGLAVAVWGTQILESMYEYFPDLQMLSGMILFAVIVVMAISVLISVMLYRFATLITRSIQAQSQAVFNHGLKSLKLYMLVSGIITVLGLVMTIITSVMEIIG
jgi:hypothetical protein